MAHETTRRALIGGAGLAAAALAAPVIAAAAPAHGSAAFRAALDANDAARKRFNNLPDIEDTHPAQYRRETDAMLEASRQADRAVPTSWQEYARLLEHMTDNGLSAIDDDNGARLLDHARRLAKKGA